ncbi:helix-turn-helix transcriptional regulator [Microvirga sp. 0TCS3.31]
MERNFLGATILRLRSAAELTQRELGDQVGVHPSRISHWERGRMVPSSEQLTALSVALAVDKQTLVGELFVVNDVERALTHDLLLSEDDKNALLTLYLSLARQRTGHAHGDEGPRLPGRCGTAAPGGTQT